jgi:hypothetical protein
MEINDKLYTFAVLFMVKGPPPIPYPFNRRRMGEHLSQSGEAIV